MTLSEFLADSARTPFAWGQRDCCLWPADWLVARGYPDPAARLRGRYWTARQALSVVKAGGGLEAIFREAALRLGLDETLEPTAGDVGIVRVVADGGAAPAGGICLGRHWAVLGDPGLIVAPMVPVAAWRV